MKIIINIKKKKIYKLKKKLFTEETYWKKNLTDKNTFLEILYTEKLLYINHLNNVETYETYSGISKTKQKLSCKDLQFS